MASTRRFLLLALLLALVAPASGQEVEQPAPATPVADAEAAQAKRDEIAGRLASLGPAASDEEREILERVDGALVGQLEALARRDDLAEATRQLEEREAQGPESLAPGEAPYPVPAFDAAVDALDAQEAHTRELVDAEAGATALLESAREELRANEQARREIQESFASATDAQRRAQLGAALRSRQLRSELLDAELALRRMELQNARGALETQRRAEALQRSLVEWIQAHVAPREEDLRRVLEEVDRREFEVGRELDAAKLDLVAAEQRWNAAQKRADAGEVQDSVRREQLRALRLEHSTEQRRVSVLSERLERLTRDRDAWRRRYAALGDVAPYEELARWKKDVAEWSAEAEREERLKSARVSELSQDLAATRERLAREREERGPATGWLQRQEAALQSLVEAYETDLAHLERSRHLQARLGADLDQRVERFDLKAQWLAVRDGVGNAWRYEITSSEDRSITVGKVATALIVFFLGLLLARIASAVLERRVLPRLRVEEGVGHAYQSLLYYFLLVVAFLVALRTVDIPLTAFAVAGGALAIGLGFGSQNIMNNFISGLILLAERPIKLGDLIDVDGTYGTVQRIGLRSTRVRSGSNVHIIVPNSAFLENRVVNWTHDNPNVRIEVKVGVVYGAPTRDVERLLRQAVDRHPRVNKTPEPIVLFKDFGDNALQFEIHFWLRMRSLMDRHRTESEIRFSIDDLFREAGIVIAFPQRDVHLDMPLEIRVAPSDTGGGGRSD